MTTSTRLVRTARAARGRAVAFLLALAALLADGVARADESELILPDLGSVTFLGMNGRTLLMGGILVCLAGLAFGLAMYGKLKNLPVHKSMLEISEGGKRPVELPGDEQRTFLQDGDRIAFTGRCSRAGYRSIGFGPCTATVLPAVR